MDLCASALAQTRTIYSYARHGVSVHSNRHTHTHTRSLLCTAVGREKLKLACFVTHNNNNNNFISNCEQLNGENATIKTMPCNVWQIPCAPYASTHTHTATSVPRYETIFFYFALLLSLSLLFICRISLVFHIVLREFRVIFANPIHCAPHTSGSSAHRLDSNILISFIRSHSSKLTNLIYIYRFYSL